MAKVVDAVDGRDCSHDYIEQENFFGSKIVFENSDYLCLTLSGHI